MRRLRTIFLALLLLAVGPVSTRAYAPPSAVSGPSSQGSGPLLAYVITIEDPSTHILTGELRVSQIADLLQTQDRLRFSGGWEPQRLLSLSFRSGVTALEWQAVGDVSWEVLVPGPVEEIVATYTLDFSTDAPSFSFLTENLGIFYSSRLFLQLDVATVTKISVGFVLPEGWEPVVSWDREGELFLPQDSSMVTRGFVGVGSADVHTQMVNGIELVVALFGPTLVPAEIVVANTAKVFEYLTNFVQYPHHRVVVFYVPPPGAVGDADFCGQSIAMSTLIHGFGEREFYLDQILSARQGSGVDWSVDWSTAAHELAHILLGASVDKVGHAVVEYMGRKVALGAGVFSTLDFYHNMIDYMAEGLWGYYEVIYGTEDDVPWSSDKPLVNEGIARVKAPTVTLYMLDRQISDVTGGQKNLDDVLAYLSRYQDPYHPVSLAELCAAVNSVSGHDFTDFCNRYVYGNEWLPPTLVVDFFAYLAGEVQQALSTVQDENARSAFEAELSVVENEGSQVIAQLYAHQYQEAFRHYAQVVGQFQMLLGRIQPRYRYVATTGLDAPENACADPIAPCRTIGYAITRADPGDQIHVASGTYTGCLAMNKPVILRGGYETGTWARDLSQRETILNGAGGCPTVVHVQGIGSGAVVDGFGVTGAQGQGGILVDGAAITIANCDIFGNVGDWGGGMLISSGAAIISNTRVISNVAGTGGGLALLHSSVVTITKSVVSGNSTTWGSAGGIGMWFDARASVADSIVSNNTTVSRGGGVNPSDGSQLELTNSLVVGNRASWGGAGVDSSDSHTSLVNVTIADNACTQGDGCTVGVSSSGDTAALTITNSILALNPGGDLSSSQGTCAVSFSDVGDAKWPGPGNIRASPRFVRMASGDYHLRPNSACINAGTSLGAPSYDLEGTARDATPDMGAYEFVGEPSPGGADIRYVTTAGSDSGADSCLDPAVPCRTIGYAISQAETGDWVEVAGGVYRENLTIVQPVQLMGGYDGATWTRDLALYETVINGSGGQTTIRLQSGSDGTVLDGLAVTGAQGDGGIYVGNTTATIANCRVFGNLGGWGGGIQADGGSAVVISHTSVYSNVSGTAGGIGILSGSVVTISDSIISGNSTTWGSAGGIGMWFDARVSVANSIVSNNTTVSRGGGVNPSDGSQLELTNSLIVANRASWGGAGVDSSDSQTTLVNVTVADNACTQGDGCTVGVSSSGSTAAMTITNSILALNPGGDLSSSQGTCAVSFSDVADAMRPGTGNISANPRFVDPANGDYHLQAGSPCIGAAAAIDAPSHDLEGHVRDPSPDMGAYEYASSWPGDMDGDCDVDIVDIMLVAARWLSRVGDASYHPHYDLDRDGDIDIVDIMRVALHWGTSCISQSAVMSSQR